MKLLFFYMSLLSSSYCTEVADNSTKNSNNSNSDINSDIDSSSLNSDNVKDKNNKDKNKKRVSFVKGTKEENLGSPDILRASYYNTETLRDAVKVYYQNNPSIDFNSMDRTYLAKIVNKVPLTIPIFNIIDNVLAENKLTLTYLEKIAIHDLVQSIEIASHELAPYISSGMHYDELLQEEKKSLKKVKNQFEICKNYGFNFKNSKLKAIFITVAQSYALLTIGAEIIKCIDNSDRLLEEKNIQILQPLKCLQEKINSIRKMLYINNDLLKLTKFTDILKTVNEKIKSFMKSCNFTDKENVLWKFCNFMEYYEYFMKKTLSYFK